MRLTAIHDAEGRIFTLLTSPAEAPLGAIVVAPGQIATEVDAAGLNVEADPRTLPDRLREIMEQYSVERASQPGAAGKLTRRSRK